MSHFNSKSGLLPRRVITKLPMSVCPGSDLRNSEVDSDKTMESDSTICLLGVQLDPLGSNSQMAYLLSFMIRADGFDEKLLLVNEITTH